MSTNTLIAFCVGLNCLLAVIVVMGAFFDRKHKREIDYDIRALPIRPIPPPTPPPPPKPSSDDKETAVTWPQRVEADVP